MPNPIAAPLPCPFCGGPAIENKAVHFFAPQIVCLNQEGCGASAWADNWNRRAPAPSREGWLTREQLDFEDAVVYLDTKDIDIMRRMALSALEPSTGKAGWMPTSEAPDHRVNGQHFVMAFSPEMGMVITAAPVSKRFTHWQPLPPPPGAETPT